MKTFAADEIAHKTIEMWLEDRSISNALHNELGPLEEYLSAAIKQSFEEGAECMREQAAEVCKERATTLTDELSPRFTGWEIAKAIRGIQMEID